jgi:hypothetical protein
MDTKLATTGLSLHKANNLASPATTATAFSDSDTIFPQLIWDPTEIDQILVSLIGLLMLETLLFTRIPLLLRTDRT